MGVHTYSKVVRAHMHREREYYTDSCYDILTYLFT